MFAVVAATQQEARRGMERLEEMGTFDITNRHLAKREVACITLRSPNLFRGVRVTGAVFVDGWDRSSDDPNMRSLRSEILNSLWACGVDPDLCDTVYP